MAIERRLNLLEPILAELDVLGGPDGFSILVIVKLQPRRDRLIDQHLLYERSVGFRDQLSLESGHLHQQALASVKVPPGNQVDPVDLCLTG